MSGPVDVRDLPETEESRPPPGPVVAVSDSRRAQVGAMEVRRALPNRGRRTVGAWCFADHYGPADVDEKLRPDIGPHPHMGLQTVTWLLAGELVHHDSLGSEQVIRPGQLNLMTAGRGVAHAEEAPDRYRGPIHGIQLWVAQPSATRDGPPAFEHHAELPRVQLDSATATVIVGSMQTTESPARRDTEHVGIDLDLRSGATEVPVLAGFEYALVVTAGAVDIDGVIAEPGHLFYLGAGRDELPLRTTAPARALLIGGIPFPDQLVMWWNFVARTREEIDTAYDDWAGDTGRFGEVHSGLARIETARPMWRPTNR